MSVGVSDVGVVADRCRVAIRHGSKQYEFATGYSTYFGPERYIIGEQFFNTNVGQNVRYFPPSFPSLRYHSFH